MKCIGMLDSIAAGDISAVRDHTQELIEYASHADKPVLIEAPPNAGKTTSAIELALHSEKPVTYLARRIDLYEQAEKEADDHDDLRYKRIPAPQRDCETFNGKHNGNANAVKKLYSKGYSGYKIHLNFREHTPCGMDCKYIQDLREIDKEAEDIDLLIGHHSHSKRQKYIEDRIVIIDEFNPEPFVHSFPDDNSPVVDHPGKIIPRFLSDLGAAEEAFPLETYADVTDIIQGRNGGGKWQEAVDWFRNHGASRHAAVDLDFFEPELKKHDDVNAYAPFLTFSLFCMERVGPGIELAPSPDGSLNEAWKAAGLGPATKCLRNRNTGKMYALQPPDLSAAEQVIGLDGTPTIDLWNLLYAPEEGFDHQQAISRDDLPRYLNSAMNMSVIQIGGGNHPYADGKISSTDSARFTAVHTLEEDRFALISTKKALKQYRGGRENLIEEFVKKTEKESIKDRNRVSPGYQALHYAIVKSSNEFEKESLGVVTGAPNPGYDVMQLWAGFCGAVIDFDNVGDDTTEQSSSELGEQIVEHFVHNQVVQAVLRFGRDESVYENEGATVYVSTYELPDWFTVVDEYTVKSVKLQEIVLAKLFEIYHDEEKHNLALRTVSQIYDDIDSDSRFGDDHSKRGVRKALNELKSKPYVRYEPDRGKHSADLYSWTGDGEILQTKDGGALLRVQDELHVVPTKRDWDC